jgi:drug/metabolite transporter (DMT)-like permease
LTDERHPRSAVLALGLGILCISCSAIFVKKAGVSGPTSAFYRVAFALLGCVPLLVFRPFRAPARGAWVPITLGGAAFAVELVVWQVALLSTSAANATLLVNLAPLWVGLGAFFFLHERQSLRFWSGAALAFAGMAIVVHRGGSNGGAVLQGDLLAALGSVFYAAYLLVTRNQRSASTGTSFLVLSTAAGVVVTFASCLVFGTPLAGFSSSQWTNLIALGLVSHLAGYLAINHALSRIAVARVSVSLLAQPVVTALLARGLLDEPLSPATVGGGAVALTGLIVALTPRRSLFEARPRGR